MSTPREQFIEHFEHKVIRACVRWSLKRGKKQEVMSNTQNLRHQSSTYYVCVDSDSNLTGGIKSGGP
jgi:hypothetical protein